MDHLTERQKECRTVSALRIPIVVHAEPVDGSAIIGHGWFNVLPDGKHTPISAMDLQGVDLPKGQYGVKISGKPMLVVIPKRVQ